MMVKTMTTTMMNLMKRLLQFERSRKLHVLDGLTACLSSTLASYIVMFSVL